VVEFDHFKKKEDHVGDNTNLGKEVSLTDFNRSLLHLIKTKPPKKDDTPPEEPEKEK